MKPRVNEDYWTEVEACMAEGTASGYKMAVIEADKILRFVLSSKGYPGRGLKEQILLAGWRLEEKKALNDALKRREEIADNLEYRLSTFEAEDAVKAYKEAIIHFSSKKPLKFKRRLILYYNHYLSLRSNFFKKFLLFFLAFFLTVKMLSSTGFGASLVGVLVEISNFLFSWFVVFFLLGSAILVLIMGSLLYFEKNKVKIKEEE